MGILAERAHIVQPIWSLVGRWIAFVASRGAARISERLPVQVLRPGRYGLAPSNEGRNGGHLPGSRCNAVKRLSAMGMTNSFRNLFALGRGKRKKRILTLFLIGVTLVTGLVAVQQLLEAFGVAREEHLERHPLTPGHVVRHIMITVLFTVISASSGAELYRLRRTR